jgi:membrane-associated protease RseP (regulator of RpoE activity)
MSFVIFDLTFLVLFTIFVIFFLRKNKKKLGKESMLGLPVYLYRARWGMELIDYIGGKFKKTLNVIKYISISLGFVLMAAMLYIIIKSLIIYIQFPQITQVIKAPPIAPLIPYFPQLFGVSNLFPPFYFTYFIIAIIIVAVVHEFSHGIFMRLFNIKIKSTGFAFFGPFLGAFVEEDRGQFAKKKNIEQMSVLSAGVFANIVFALIFFGLLVGFFFAAFSQGGYVFNTYSYSFIPASNVTGMENLSLNLTPIYVGNQTYFLDNTLKTQLGKNLSILTVYEDAPAIKSGLAGAITSINGFSIKNKDDLGSFLTNSSPEQNVTITTIQDNQIKEYHLTLASNPKNNSLGYLGIGNLQTSNSGIVSTFVGLFTSFKDPSIYYQPKFDAGTAKFIYDFLWWIMIINFLVGLFNMLPLGILDGGRFFYLGIFSLTKSKKIAEYSFKIVTYAIAMVFILLLFFWFIAII